MIKCIFIKKKHTYTQYKSVNSYMKYELLGNKLIITINTL